MQKQEKVNVDNMTLTFDPDFSVSVQGLPIKSLLGYTANGLWV